VLIYSNYASLQMWEEITRLNKLSESEFTKEKAKYHIPDKEEKGEYGGKIVAL